MKRPVVILVRPQAYGNLGAIARSMANFGFADLRVVGALPSARADHSLAEEISQSDWALATPRGHEILKNLRRFDTFQESLADCQFVLGTSGKKEPYQGGFHRPVVSPEVAFAEACHTADLQTALVFGPEDDGLSSEEAAHCDLLIHIPTSIEAPSMNLAMAATLLFYTCQQASGAPQAMPTSASEKRSRKISRDEIAPSGEMEALVLYVLRTLEPTQFFKLPDPEAAKARLRRVLREWRLTRGDLLFIFEIFYQLKCWGQGSFDERNFLKKPGDKGRPPRGQPPQDQ